MTCRNGLPVTNFQWGRNFQGLDKTMWKWRWYSEYNDDVCPANIFRSLVMSRNINAFALISSHLSLNESNGCASLVVTRQNVTLFWLSKYIGILWLFSQNFHYVMHRTWMTSWATFMNRLYNYHLSITSLIESCDEWRHSELFHRHLISIPC